MGGLLSKFGPIRDAAHAPSTTLTFWPPDNAEMRWCVANSASKPTFFRWDSTLDEVKGRNMPDAACATFTSTFLQALSQPARERSRERRLHLLMKGVVSSSGLGRFGPHAVAAIASR